MTISVSLSKLFIFSVSPFIVLNPAQWGVVLPDRGPRSIRRIVTNAATDRDRDPLRGRAVGRRPNIRRGKVVIPAVGPGRLLNIRPARAAPSTSRVGGGVVHPRRRPLPHIHRVPDLRVRKRNRSRRQTLLSRRLRRWSLTV